MSKELNHVKMECSTPNALVWVKENVIIDKRTTISVDDGFKVYVVRGGSSGYMGAPIGACKNANLFDVTGLTKKESKCSDTYSFYYYVSSNRHSDFSWGTQGSALEPLLNVPFKYGASGTYTISITSPRILFEALGRKSPVIAEDIEGPRGKPTKIFRHIQEKASVAITNFIKEQKLSAFDLDSKKTAVANAVLLELNKDTAIFDKMGISLLDISVPNLGLNEDEEANLKALLEQKKAKESH